MNIISDWLEKHGDPKIAEQVRKEAELLNKQYEMKPQVVISLEEYERLRSLSETAFKAEAAIEEIHDHIKLNPDKTDKVFFIIDQYNEWSLKHNG